MKKLLSVCLLTGILILLNHMSHAQDKWGLRRCVDYALANNISIKQADVQARLAKLALEQSRMQRIPTLVLGAGAGVNSGNSLNPTNYTIYTNTFFYNN